MNYEDLKFEADVLELKIRMVILKLGSDNLAYVVLLIALLFAHIMLQLTSPLKTASHLFLLGVYVFLVYKITED